MVDRCGSQAPASALRKPDLSKSGFLIHKDDTITDIVTTSSEESEITFPS